MIRKSIKLYKKYEFSIVHCRSYIPSLAGMRLKNKYGVKFIFDMRGFWADERVDGNLWDLKNPLYKIIYNFFKRKEKQFLQNADVVLSLTETAKQEMLNWGISNLTNKKIHVIPCAADFEHFNPDKITDQQKNELRKKLNIKENGFVLSYLGSIGTWYLLDEMLDFFKLLLQSNPKSVFLFITNESNVNIKNKAKLKGIDEKHLRMISVSRKDVPAYLSIADYGIFFIKPSYSKMASSPVKMGEFLAMNIPVIANDVGDIKNLINKYADNSCILIKDFQQEYYLNAIKQLNNAFKNKSLRLSFEEYYSLKFGIEKYNKIYNQLNRKW
jgi:glycosyltransferase involved in cell wall biosynthesis